MSSTSPSVSLGRQLFTMTWPMLFGVLSLMSFQLVDSAFIGQLGVLPLAVQGFTLPLQMIIIGIQVGLGIATTAVIARALGADQHRYAKQLGGLVLTIGSVGVALFSLLLYLLRTPILSLLGAPDSVFAIVDSYWIYWLVSAWTGAVVYFLYSICRANGNTLLPGIMMVVTSLLNLVLDPLFIFTFDLGINGAAIATLLAFGIGVVFITPKVLARHWMSFDWSDLHIGQSVRSLTRIMGPAMISQLLPPVSSMLATKLLAGYGTAAVASWALGSRYEFFAIVTVLALTMSVPPMIGRLLGAGDLGQIRRLINLAGRFILISQLVIAVVTYFCAEPLSDLMTSDPSVTAILHWHLILVPISLGPLGICMLMVSVSNALGQAYTALTISALRLFVFFLPCLWLGAQLADIYGLLVGALIGNVLAGLCAWWLHQRGMRQLEQR